MELWVSWSWVLGLCQYCSWQKPTNLLCHAAALIFWQSCSCSDARYISLGVVVHVTGNFRLSNSLNDVEHAVVRINKHSLLRESGSPCPFSFIFLSISVPRLPLLPSFLPDTDPFTFSFNATLYFGRMTYIALAIFTEVRPMKYHNQRPFLSYEYAHLD